MTLNDIKKEVAHLGFESEGALGGGIESAARRALYTIYTEHGPVTVGRIYQNPKAPTDHIPMIVHTPSEDEVIPITGGAYAFVACGVGSFEIEDENGTREEHFDTAGSYVYGRIKGEGEIRFKGEFRYTVYDLCIYSEEFAEKDAPPRWGKTCEYELEKTFPDFLCAVSHPTDKNGVRIAGATVYSGVMHVPYGYVGEVQLEYRKRAPSVSINTPDLDLEIPKELESLVPLLTAAYVWLDDDAEKAQYYMSLYREGMSALKIYTRRAVDTAFTDATGWA
jgi:hypothetical protein